jgi:hypothetical protein
VSRAALRHGALALSIGLLSACQTPPSAPPTHAEIVRQQLSLLLASQHPSCGAVRLYSRRDRLDYRVECSSGEVYRVRVSGDGHVLITPY